MLDNPNSVLYARKGTADLFLHITSTYKFTGYDILPDLSLRAPISPARA
jgi:NADPH dehydrogenase (quinone)